MQIAAFVRALKVWWQHAWHSTVRTFHLVVAFLFFAIAALVGQKACLALRAYDEHPEKGLWLFYVTGGIVVVLIIFALYSMLKARTVRR